MEEAPRHTIAEALYYTRKPTSPSQRLKKPKEVLYDLHNKGHSGQSQIRERRVYLRYALSWQPPEEKYWTRWKDKTSWKDPILWGLTFINRIVSSIANITNTTIMILKIASRWKRLKILTVKDGSSNTWQALKGTEANKPNSRCHIHLVKLHLRSCLLPNHLYETFTQ